MDNRLPFFSRHSGLRYRKFAQGRTHHHCDSVVRRYEFTSFTVRILVRLNSLPGEPADNAAKFVDWLRNIKGNEFSGVRYGVFGCGNHDWASTYQRIPTLCDDLLEQHGGKRLVNRGEGDAAASNFFETFDEFEAKLWVTLSMVLMLLCQSGAITNVHYAQEFHTSKKESVSTGFEVKTVDPGTHRAAALRQPDAALGRVVENRILTKPGVPMKRHIGKSPGNFFTCILNTGCRV